jgi:hypothetical protein
MYIQEEIFGFKKKNKQTVEYSINENCVIFTGYLNK